MMKKLRYALEAALVWVLFFIFGMLQPQQASAIGGWIGRSIGPHLATSRKALRHLGQSLPELSEAERKETIKKMWNNLGRVVAEYPHLEAIARDYTTIHGLEHLDLAIPKAHVFIGAHVANWELYGVAALVKQNLPLDLTYRAPNNPWTAGLLNRARSLNGRINTYPKGREGGRALLESLKKGRSLGILIDQKYNEGIESLFFEQPAMTNPIFVKLCQKYKCPLYPIQMVREEGCRFHLYVHPQIPVFDAQNQPRSVEDVIKDAHTLLESWIRQNPAQWIWVHRRWKS